MDPRTESEETSNDTTMISELLKSAEVMQQSHLIAVPSPTPTGNSDPHEQTPQQIIDMTGKQIVLPPSPPDGMGPNTDGVIMINTDFSDTDGSNKLHQIRHVHIPYILNGELYQIQTQDGENVTVKCCHCPPDRVYRGSVRSTGNFHMHIKRRHPDLLEKLHNMKVNALLERRDRLMRNRKVSSRNSHRNRQNCTSGNSFIASGAVADVVAAFKDETKVSLTHSLDDQLPTTSSTPELSLMHTHKLKIKTVFQRHQMQQREAAAMRNWNNTDYDMVPKLSSSYKDGPEEPLNYSLKSQEEIEENSSVAKALQQQHQQNNNTHTSVSTTCKGENTNTADQQLPGVRINNEQEKNQQFSIRDMSTTSSQSSTSSPSVLSTYSSSFNDNQHSCNVGAISQYERSTHQKMLSIIKPEHLLISADEQQAIDLSMHTDSGIFSNSNESIPNIPQNVTAITNEQRAGSRHMLTPQAASGRGISNGTSKWHELLVHVETSLRDIQQELNIRNQIESNRMFLDIAKFKFLHPGFQFNW